MYAWRVRLAPVFALALGSLVAGCAVAPTPRLEPPIVVPDTIANADDYTTGLNALAVMDNGSKRRPELQQRLLGYVLARAPQGEGPGAKLEREIALREAVGLFRPRDLGAAAPNAQLVLLARKSYGESGSSGDEGPALLALLALHQFGSKADRSWARAQWDSISEWMDKGREFSRDPQNPSDLERLLEETTADFPSPWGVELLSALYIERYRALRGGVLGQRRLGETDAHRVSFTGYLLARLHLRADDLEGALEALETVGTDETTRDLEKLIARAAKEPRSAKALGELMAYFEPELEPDSDLALPPFVISQGFGILENLSRRTLQDHPADGRANLRLARALSQKGLDRGAVVLYRRGLKSRQDDFIAWQELAYLEHTELQRLAQQSPQAAKDRLPELQNFYQRAQKKWGERPIFPGLPSALVTVAQGLYESGDPEGAQELLDEVMAVEPLPQALELRGTIAFKRGDLVASREAYEALLELPFADQFTRMHWEITSRTQLGQIALVSGDKAQGQRQLQAALAELNLILSLPDLEPFERGGWLTERSRVFFYLGETELAMDDFRSASSAVGDRMEVYADPLLLAVGHGYFGEAREIYDKAMEQDLPESLKVYFSLWIDDLGDRQGKKHSGARNFLDGYEGSGWLAVLVQQRLGEISLEQALAKADDPGEKAEAYFYAGVMAWGGGNGDLGLELMSKVLDTGMMSFFEYEMAQNFLWWRELPKTARSPLEPAVSHKR